MLALSGAAGTVLLATVLAGCGVTPNSVGNQSSSQQPGGPASSASQPSPSPTSTPTPAQRDSVKLTANVKNGATGVGVDTLVKVAAADGTLTKVKLTYTDKDRDGRKHKGSVAGKLSKNKKTWTAAGRLDPAAAYKLTMSGKNEVNAKTTTVTKFKTRSLSLSQQTFPTMYPLKGMEVGIGMPVVLSFDVPVKNKHEFEKNLHVTSSPDQVGSWRWFSDTEVRFRPKEYWKPGTKVTAWANVNGVNAGNGIYGQSSAKTSFEVGRSMKIRINLASDVAKVYRNGKVVRTIYVSAGKPGWQTRSGVKLIMGKEYNKKMTNEMIGAKEDYTLVSQYAMRITNSGEFIHSAPWNAGYFGRSNASHGCTGMSNADAGWLYARTLVGDPVITTGTSRQMELENGYGDWNLSYSKYKQGSAL
jgi:lipoprotein-anchoring transpeptidase ErfK/SrfK